MSFLAFLCRREHQFGGQGGGGGGSRFAGLERPIWSCGPEVCALYDDRIRDSCSQGCLDAWMLGCLEVCQDKKALGMLDWKALGIAAVI